MLGLMNTKDRQRGKLESPVDPPDIATSSIDEVKQLKDQLYEMQMKIVRVDGMEYALAYSEFHNLESQALPQLKSKRKPPRPQSRRKAKTPVLGYPFLVICFYTCFFR